MTATKTYKVADSPQDTAAWSHVTLLAGTHTDVSPRTTGHVESLGAWATNKTAFSTAMKTLRTFHAFGALSRYCATNPEQMESTLRIVLALMEDGLASPGAAAWAMEHLTKSPQNYQAARFHYAAYRANCRTLWNQRNQSLAAWKATRDLPANSPMAEAPKAAEGANPSHDDRSQSEYEPNPLPEAVAESNAMTPKSAHPCSLPSASGWALPVSETMSKYAGLTAVPKQTQSASASGASKPLEGQSDPRMTRPMRAVRAKAPTKATAVKEKKKATGKN